MKGYQIFDKNYSFEISNEKKKFNILLDKGYDEKTQKVEYEVKTVEGYELINIKPKLNMELFYAPKTTSSKLGSIYEKVSGMRVIGFMNAKDKLSDYTDEINKVFSEYNNIYKQTIKEFIKTHKNSGIKFPLNR